MTFSKYIFYVLYIFNALSLLFYVGTLYSNLTSRKEFAGKNETLIFSLAIIIIALGLYLAHNKAFCHKNFTIANIAFVVSWVVALIIIIIGLLFFNGPIRWN
jgi:hypothetical protein